MAAALFSTEFREEMDEAGQKKAFEDTVRKVKRWGRLDQLLLSFQ